MFRFVCVCAHPRAQETVGVFLSHPSVKDEPDLEGRTAFMWAAGKGSDDVIRTMLSFTSHMDINMADKYGGTGEPWPHVLFLLLSALIT